MIMSKVIKFLSKSRKILKKLDASNFALYTLEVKLQRPRGKAKNATTKAKFSILDSQRPMEWDPMLSDIDF